MAEFINNYFGETIAVSEEEFMAAFVSNKENNERRKWERTFRKPLARLLKANDVKGSPVITVENSKKIILGVTGVSNEQISAAAACVANAKSVMENLSGAANFKGDFKFSPEVHNVLKKGGYFEQV